MKKYFTNNPSLSDKDAAKIGSFIEKHCGGNVTPKQLLDIARDEKSFLHKFFEWDDNIAAERYRLTQARSLIVSIYVEADDDKPMRSFLRVNIGSGSTYLGCDQVKESKDLIDQVMITAHDQLVRWRDRYGRYCEFFDFNFSIKGKQHVIKSEEDSSKRGKYTRGEKRANERNDRGAQPATR